MSEPETRCLNNDHYWDEPYREDTYCKDCGALRRDVKDIATLEAKLKAMGRFIFERGLDEQYDAWTDAQQEQEDE